MGYIMEYMTVKDIEEALKKTKTVIIPFGCVEQHGYHLPLSTDMHFASEIPRRAADRLNAVIAPTIPYTFSGGELPGTVNVSPQVFSLYDGYCSGCQNGVWEYCYIYRTWWNR